MTEMTQSMINSVERTLKLLKMNLENGLDVQPTDVKKVNNLYNNFIKNNTEVSDEKKAELESQIASYNAYVDQAVVEKTHITMPKSDVDKIKSSTASKVVLGAGIVTLAAGIAIATLGLKGCGTEEIVEPTAIEAEAPTPIEEPQEVVKEEVKKVLSESLAFDPNDNHELVNRMIEFIADGITKGIPVKDVMTADEIKKADEADESLVTIAQLIDFYMVMNIEDIDPADYARLAYNNKTAETITDNYMYCARVFMTDSLTAGVSDEIDYTTIIAHKDSAEQLQKFVDYLAKYNDSKVDAKEISDYIMDQYIEKDANLYSMSTNELVYRFMFDADMISNNTIIPKDVNIILNEDGKISCDTQKDDGVKNKTEKAEEFTSIYNAVDEKLEISREFLDQDLTNIDEYELKTGAELEEEIKNAVLAKNVRYNANKKFVLPKNYDGSGKVVTKNGGKSYITAVSPSTGKLVSVSLEELAKYNATNLAEYEAAKQKEFEENAKKDPKHTIKDNDGNVLVTGPEADAEQYKLGYQVGYSDGNNKRTSNPNSSNKSYVAGYNEGYAQGLADRKAFDAQYKDTKETTFVDTPDKTVEKDDKVEVKPYVPDPVPPQPQPDPTPVDPTPQPPAPAPSEPVTVFEPVDNDTVEKEEVIEVIDYVSSLKNLREMLVSSNSIDSNKTIKM